MNSTVTYQCPNCGAGLLFDADKQAFTCEFCLSEFKEEELEGTDSAEKAREAEANAEEFCEHMNEYLCQSCGAEIVTDENSVATFCPFCHNPVILVGKLSGQMRPDKIIPFKYDREAAEEMFLKAVKKKWFLPRNFFSADQREKITGIYYPFWVTDADTDCYAEANATKVRTWTMGNYRYTETSRFLVKRQGEIHFEDIVSSALSEADKAMLEGVLPYPSDSLQEFSMPYLLGFQAKKRDIDRDALTPEVRAKMDNYAETLLKNSMNMGMGYATINVNEKNVKVLKSHWEYSLMPIWIMIYKGKDRNYTYAMNGYTGKIYGEYPYSRLKVFLTAGIVGIVSGIVAALLGGAFIC